MKIKCFYLIFFLLIGIRCFSQKNNGAYLMGSSVSYQYQDRNFLKFSAFGTIIVDDPLCLKIDLGSNFTIIDNKYHLIPELGLTYYFLMQERIPIMFFVKNEITPYTTTPKLGVSLVTFMDVGIGYGFSIGNKGNLKATEGFTFSIGINLPILTNLKIL